MAAKTAAEKSAERAARLRAVLEPVTAPRGVLGLDLSLNGPGFALVGRGGVIRTDHIKMSAKFTEGEKLLATSAKVLDLAMGSDVPVDLIVIEEPFITSDNGSKVLWVHGAVRVMLAAAKCTAPIITVVTAQMKSFALAGEFHAGDGKAPMVAVARERFGMVGYDPDEADALLLAEMGWALLGEPQAELPAGATAQIVSMLTGKAKPKVKPKVKAPAKSRAVAA